MKGKLAILVILMMGASPAWAVLGDNAASVDSDAQALNGQHVIVAKAGFNLHQITMQDGSTVNEYVSPAGTVFAISWKSHFMPNLNQLLGSYLTNLQQGQRTQWIRRRAVTIQGNDFVLTSFGRMGSFQGRAYVPSLVPANLTAEVVQ